jgi:HD-GYP domain-containing protein (c-di-GMP phosphodiesterase class II)
MFVEDLDRPWLDTPFLIQGFLLEEESDLKTLQQLCRHVYIDPLRSTADLLQARPAHQPCPAAERSLPASGLGHPQGQASAPRDRGHPTIGNGEPEQSGSPAGVVVAREWGGPTPPMPPPAAEAGHTSTTHPWLRPLGRVKALVGDLTRLRRLGRAPSPRPAFVDERKPDPSLAPPGVRLLVYPDETPVRAELPRAQKSFARAHEVLDKLSHDMRTGTPVDVQHVDEVVTDMVDSMVINPDALMWIARLRQQHNELYSHGVQVAVYLLALGRHLGFPKDQLGYLGAMGLLLDLGKTALPRDLLDKPGRLTEEEFDLVKQHVEYGLEVVSSGPTTVRPEILEGIAQHHERLNGLGYPKGLKGQQIGIYGRMAGIADCFTALTSPRPYAEVLSVSDAMMRLYKWGDDLFSQPLVEKLVQAIGVFPVGSLVELSSGEVAIVVRHNRVRRLQPTVLVIAGRDKLPLMRFATLDLLSAGTGATGGQIHVHRGLPAGAYGLDTSACYLSAA